MKSWVALALMTAGLLAFPAQGSILPEAANPTWSPDGTQIAYSELRVSNQTLEVMNAVDGSGKRALFTGDSCCEPVLWGAGNRIVFGGNYQLSTVGAGGGKRTTLFTGTPWFILSPDRETIAFDDGCGCGHSPDAIGLVATRGGGKPFVIPRLKNMNDSIDGFSPDGTQLVFTRSPWNYEGNPKGKPAIMVENLHLRGAPVPLARSGLIGGAYVPANAVWPQWSPDGKWIAYIEPGAKPKLELQSTAGGRSKLLVVSVGASGFSWSPRSDRIAYTTYETRTALGHLMTVDLKGRRTLVSGAVNWISGDSWNRPQWSPDATKLVFTGLVGRNVPGRGPSGVWVVNADGTGLKRLA